MEQCAPRVARAAATLVREYLDLHTVSPKPLTWMVSALPLEVLWLVAGVSCLGLALPVAGVLCKKMLLLNAENLLSLRAVETLQFLLVLMEQELLPPEWVVCA